MLYSTTRSEIKASVLAAASPTQPSVVSSTLGTVKHFAGVGDARAFADDSGYYDDQARVGMGGERGHVFYVLVPGQDEVEVY